MTKRARRPLSRVLHRHTRRVVLAACLWLTATASAVVAEQITAARFTDPTDRYGHGILGDAIEWGTLELTLKGGKRIRLTLPQTRVFEDLAPRLADLDGDGSAEVIVIETSIRQGARLAIYSNNGLLTATPYIGRTHRWLAPIGYADLDGDGKIELAYIDRPHLAKTLRIWRYENGKLIHVADHPGLTNHKIGWPHIPGGIRNCGQGPQLITANADWSQIMATRLTTSGQITSQPIGRYTGPNSLNVATTCN